MKFIFIIQGEGRGHLTQALSFASLLRSQGHEILGAVVGKSQRRTLPDFFIQKIGVPITLVDSPNFETDGIEKKILLGKTVWKNTLKLSLFWKSIQAIHKLLKEKEPDVIVNFYEILGGIYPLFHKTNASIWVIGHQYLERHPAFTFAPNRPIEKFLFRMHTRLTANRAHQQLALSFLPKENTKEIKVVPPLLRPEIRNLQISEEGFFLAYMVNPGYAEEVIRFAKEHPNRTIKAFWDKKEAAEIEYPLPNLSFHKVNDQGFLEAMASCSGLVCTAGFESVCEAMYLGKPVIMVPVTGQYEQACNALDGEYSGAGLASDRFDFEKLATLSSSECTSHLMKAWVDQWPKKLQELTAEERVNFPFIFQGQLA